VDAALYVHLPFCPYVCPYCDFAKWAYDGPAAARYLAALEAEIAHAPGVRGTTLFFGGGTPNTYEPAVLAALVERLRARFGLSPEAEISLEINPDLTLCAGLEIWRGAGINRLSIGVQSFVADELRVLGRRHTAADVGEVVGRARAAGFANVSIDLMFGVPGQTETSWRQSLDAALALDPQHVSTYGLTIEEGTPYARWFAREPSAFAGSDREADFYALAIATLAAAGFEHYEISNFARPGRRCRHNETYWRNGEYLGLGVGAASYRGGVRSVNTREREVYVAAALAGAPIPGEAETLEPQARLGEAIMLALRTREGVDAPAFLERYGVDVRERYRSAIERLEAGGLLESGADFVRLTERGRFVANDVCAAFLS
jgi:oxygen-independent coproporphyrinogen-3 oxidase